MRNRNADHNQDPDFPRDAIEREDPEGEASFAAEGFEDAPGGGPAFGAPGMEDDPGRRPGGHGQKMAGIPADRQRVVNTPSDQRPDAEDVVIRERGGASKGDPAVGGTRD